MTLCLPTAGISLQNCERDPRCFMRESVARPGEHNAFVPTLALCKREKDSAARAATSKARCCRTPVVVIMGKKAGGRGAPSSPCKVQLQGEG